ncbi:MAG: c-type cytochrome [Acidobacteriota bacterium]
MSSDRVIHSLASTRRRRRRDAVALLLFVAASVAVFSSTVSADEVVVKLADIEFHPAEISVSPGQSVRFINNDPFEHDVYVVDAANKNLVVVPRTLLAPGKSTTVSVKEKAVYKVYCTIHGGMQARLTTTGSFELTAEQKERAARAAPVLPPIVKTGEELFWGKAMCHHCHSMGNRGDGLRGPNLQNIGLRADAQAERFGLDSGTDYIVHSILEPDRNIVAGYTNDMPHVFQPPIDLDAGEIKAIVTYLQSQGGTVDTWAIDIPEDQLDYPLPPSPFSGGDPVRGRKVFADDASCNSCHQVGDERPVSVGPDLTELGKFRDWAWMAQAIFHPADEIGANWTSGTVTLNSGDTVTGVIQKKTSKEIRMLTAGNHVRIIPSKDVKSVQIDEGTRMPDTYDEIITFQQTADLISYLETLKGSAPKK